MAFQLLGLFVLSVVVPSVPNTLESSEQETHEELSSQESSSFEEKVEKKKKDRNYATAVPKIPSAQLLKSLSSMLNYETTTPVNWVFWTEKTSEGTSDMISSSEEQIVYQGTGKRSNEQKILCMSNMYNNTKLAVKFGHQTAPLFEKLWLFKEGIYPHWEVSACKLGGKFRIYFESRNSATNAFLLLIARALENKLGSEQSLCGLNICCKLQKFYVEIWLNSANLDTINPVEELLMKLLKPPYLKFILHADSPKLNKFNLHSPLSSEYSTAEVLEQLSSALLLATAKQREPVKTEAREINKLTESAESQSSSSPSTKQEEENKLAQHQQSAQSSTPSTKQEEANKLSQRQQSETAPQSVGEALQNALLVASISNAWKVAGH